MNPSAALHRAAGNDFDIVGQLGAAQGVEAYLALERSTRRLVALSIDPKKEPQSRFDLIVSHTLNASVPASDHQCPICRARLSDWRRFCPQCGADISGVDPGEADGSFTEAFRKDIDLLGHMPRSEGGGAVYFGRERTTGRILALNFNRNAQSNTATKLSFSITSIIKAGSQGQSHADQPNAGVMPPDAAVGKVCPQCNREFDDKTRFCQDDGTVLRPRTQSDNLIGQIIDGRFHILRLIGQGGMGHVYLAEHVRMGRRCAIKMMNRSMSHDVDAVARFSREAANASRINSDNVAQIYDSGETREHGVYLAMEYVDGRPLGKIVAEEGPLPVERAVDITKQICRALSAAHAENVVHRDLTPNNVMVGRSRAGGDLIKVVDFGIAKAIQDTGAGLTRTGFVVGTPQYMSPEQLMGDSLDGRSDLYSLGCILYEMLAGVPPFHGEMINKRLTGAPRNISELNPGVPASVERVLNKALALRLEDRFLNAAEFRDALETAARSEVAPATDEKPRRGWFKKAQAAAPKTDPKLRTSAPSPILKTPTPPLTPSAPAPQKRTPAAQPVTPRSVEHAAPPVVQTPVPQHQWISEESTAGTAEPVVAPVRRRGLLIAAVLAGVLLLGVVSWNLLQSDGNRVAVRFAIDLPEGTQITANGNPVSLAENTLELDAGSYVIEIAAPGRETVSQTIDLQSDFEWTTPLPAQVPPPPEMARVRFGTLPSDARLLINGQTTEFEAGKVITLNPGTYRVEIRARGYQAAVANMTLAAGQDFYWNGTFVPEPVRLTLLNLPPGAAFSVNPQPVGITGNVIRALPGSYVLAVTAADGRQRFERTVELLVGQNREVRIELGAAAVQPSQNENGTVRFSGEIPADAEIQIDGGARLRMVNNLSLKTGEHRLVITANGRLPFSQTVTVQSGDVVEVAVTLAEDRPTPVLLSFSNSATQVVQEFEAAVEAKNLTAYRAKLLSHYLTAFEDVFKQNVPLRVDTRGIVATDSVAGRVAFELRIVHEGPNTTLMPWRPFVAKLGLDRNRKWTLVRFD
jgi:eukaryotic-like serine/threonine-protein kinase